MIAYIPDAKDIGVLRFYYKIVEIGNFLKEQPPGKWNITFDQYVDEIRTWLQSPDKAPTPSALKGMSSGMYSWMNDPALRKQFLRRIYWALKQIM